MMQKNTARYFASLPILSIVVGMAILLFQFLWYLLMPVSASAGQSDPRSLGNISGVVTNINGEAIKGIIVSLRSVFQSEPAYQITTTENGIFNFTGLIPSVYRLRADDPAKVFSSQYYSATNYFDTATDITIDGNRIEDLRFILETPGRIIGKVTLGGELPPIVSEVKNYAYIYSRNTSGLQVLASAEIISSTGIYMFDALLPAIYQICAEIRLPLGGGYATSCYGGVGLDSATGITLTSHITLSNIDFDVDHGQFEGVIGGQVSVRGIPIHNIRVDLQGGSATNSLNVYTMTDSAGRYEFRGLPTGTYSALFADPTNLYPRVWHDLRPAGPDAPSLYYEQPIQLESGQVISNIDVDIPEYGALQGKVVRYNPPLSLGEEISIGLSYATANSRIDLARSATVDASGNYTVVRVFPGVYTISFVYCFPQGNGTGCIYRYYGMSSTDATAKPVIVSSGQVITGIDSTIGFDPTIYLPLIMWNS